MGAVALWLVDTHADRAPLEAAEAKCPRLADDEIRRSLAFADRERAAEWRCAHIALRLALEITMGVAARRVGYSIGGSGQPSLPFTEAPAFSLSHCAHHALVAVAHVGSIGCDIEAVRPIRLSPERTRRLIAAGAGLAGATFPHRIEIEDDVDPIRAWTRLEAFGKARGTGVGPVLAACNIAGKDGNTGGGNQEEMSYRRAAQLLATSGLTVCDLVLPGGRRIMAAIACASGLASSRCLANIGCAADLLRAVENPRN